MQYQVLTDCTINGVRYKAGDTVDVVNGSSEKLLNRGLIGDFDVEVVFEDEGHQEVEDDNEL